MHRNTQTHARVEWRQQQHERASSQTLHRACVRARTLPQLGIRGFFLANPLPERCYGIIQHNDITLQRGDGGFGFRQLRGAHNHLGAHAFQALRVPARQHLKLSLKVVRHCGDLSIIRTLHAGHVRVCKLLLGHLCIQRCLKLLQARQPTHMLTQP